MTVVTRGFQRDDAVWKARLQSVLMHAAAHGRLPGQGQSAAPAERSLALWLANQRREHSCGLMPSDRVEQLDSTLPGWRGRHRW
ncbi:hypothetical protein GIS00_24640 [Nakamurella sp. YIM 132087]|uniref:Helicase-associated domain-containing protein n=1 Tax=Nakamurella alba TaxID=2665158 RepID=A0A7K1FSN3_9ACTN|nr:hypothetical protein [Nakamurella alba]